MSLENMLELFMKGMGRLLDLSNKNLETIDEKELEKWINLERLYINKNKLTAIDGKAFKTLVKLSILKLEENQIETITDNAFEKCINLKELHLNGNKLTSINRKAFGNLRTLIKLWLSNNKIETISNNAFENCPNLLELYLAGNKLTRIYSGTFINLLELAILVLCDNQIETIDENAFDNCIKLKVLDLSKNNLKSIDGKEFHKLVNLSILKLNENQIKTIADNTFEKCINLEDLHLNGNKLTCIDGRAFGNQNLVKLSILRLEENQIETIAENSFGNCTSLEQLDLNDNKLKTINGEEFQKLVNLTFIGLHNNKIETIAENTFKKCINLKKIGLCGNKLTIIEEKTFQKLEKLSFLRLDKNQIKTIAENAFENFTNLENLELHNNKLIRIDGNTFINLRLLKRLVLCDNQIKTIAVNAFDNCINLENLYLNGNKLTKIESNTFKNLRKLTKLWLFDNKIETIAVNTIENCTNLDELDLSGNTLTRIDGNTFKNLRKLTKLELYNNKLETIADNAFENCTNLKELYLSGNKLTQIDGNTFMNLRTLSSNNKDLFLSKLVNLSILRLGQNKIETIPENAFENCTNLKELRLNENKLARIEGNSFKNLNLLTHLYLHYNQIDYIDQAAFKDCCSSLKELNLNGNKLKKIDCNHLKNLEVLSLSGNQLTNIERNNFSNLTKIKELDLSNNGIGNNLEFEFNCSQSNVNINLSLNYFKKANLKFSSDTQNQIRINISSNEINCLSDIEIVSNNQNSSFEINAKFNLIQEIPFDNPIIINQLKRNKIFNISKNPLNLDTREALKKEINKENFIVEFIHTNEDRFIKSINFDFLKDLKDRYSFIEGLKDWNNISPFSVITGKNGVGKSTILNYMKDFIDESYKQTLENINNVEDQESIKNKSFFIPVVYKMHDKIKPDIIHIEEFDGLANEFIGKLMKKDINQWNWKNFEQVKSIFTVDSIDKLILQFNNSIDQLNQHLNDFKYKIEIDDQSNVYFINKQSSKTIRIESSSLSPGEQLMMLFRLWEFALTRYEIPHTPVLLLDEPDAHLHPQAVHEFVNILDKLSKAGAQIIMTTHNPTTVSLVKKENLFCMKSDSNGLVSIEKANSKTEVIRELTNNLILVNEPYRVVLVEGKPYDTFLPEPEYKENERDALFYRFVHSRLSESSVIKNESTSTSPCKNLAQVQLVFKSFSGHDSILDFLKRIDNELMYQDHCTIIDNDNYFQICSNQPSEIEKYYKNRNNRRFNLLRHSLENYILDPINLFVYLNSFTKQAVSKGNPKIRVNETSLKKFHERIAKEMLKSAEKPQDYIQRLEKLQKTFCQIVKVDDMIKNIDLSKAVVEVLGHKLVEYLTQIDGFEYRLFKRKNELKNLTPMFHFIANQVNSNLDETNFFSIKLLDNKKTDSKKADKTKDSQKTDHNKADKIDKNKTEKTDLRLEFLTNDAKETEESSKKDELEKIKGSLANLIKKPFDNLVKNSALKKLAETFQAVFKSDQFRKSIKHEIKNQEEIRLHILDFIDWINSQGDEASKKLIANIDINELKAYINSKYQFDQLLIDDIKNYLLQTVNCCFFENENQVFEYPLIFYKLRGHNLEEIIFEMFFENCKDNSKKLVKDFLRDDGVMKTCGYLVPNELPEIFKKIIQVGSERSSST